MKKCCISSSVIVSAVALMSLVLSGCGAASVSEVFFEAEGFGNEAVDVVMVGDHLRAYSQKPMEDSAEKGRAANSSHSDTISQQFVQWGQSNGAHDAEVVADLPKAPQEVERTLQELFAGMYRQETLPELVRYQRNHYCSAVIANAGGLEQFDPDIVPQVNLSILAKPHSETPKLENIRSNDEIAGAYVHSENDGAVLQRINFRKEAGQWKLCG